MNTASGKPQQEWGDKGSEKKGHPPFNEQSLRNN